MVVILIDLLIIVLLIGVIVYGYYVFWKVYVLMGVLKEFEFLINEYFRVVDKLEVLVVVMK